MDTDKHGLRMEQKGTKRTKSAREFCFALTARADFGREVIPKVKPGGGFWVWMKIF